MTNSNAILPTRNKQWGFWGTIASYADVEAAWPLAMTAIVDTLSCEPETARDFLDSRYGRHFADSVTEALAREKTLEEAIDDAITRWMDWTISKHAEREKGIPSGLPYLTGIVLHCQMKAEAFD